MGSSQTHNSGQSLVLVGAGPIGLAAASAAVADGAAFVTGVVDPDERARDTAGETLDCPTYPTIADLDQERPDIALVAFSSNAFATAPSIRLLVERGCHVVTTCEELAYPEAGLRDELDAASRAAGVAIVVTGANPGFVMDRLTAVIALAGRNVDKVTVVRRLDTRTRRGPLVAKTGYGLPVEEFRSLATASRLGHVGLAESANLVAEVLGWTQCRTTSTLEPVLGDSGDVLGQHQVFTLDAEGPRKLVFDLEMSWGASDPCDRITASGEFDLDVEIHGGYPGDEGTTAMVVRAIDTIAQRSPGFYRPTDRVAGH